jgi:hypothetical protein
MKKSYFPLANKTAISTTKSSATAECGAAAAWQVARWRWKQPPCVLMGICQRRWIVPISLISVHQRRMRGAPTAPKTLGEHLRVKRIDMGLTQPQLAEKLG